MSDQEDQVGGLISNEAAIELAEQQGGSREQIESAAAPAPEASAASPPKPAAEMKIVIVIKDDNILLGVQSPDCDPVYKTMKGALPAALKQVSALVTEAKQQWETNPRYPKADLPQPPPSPAPARTSVTPKPAKVTNQPSFF